MYRILWQNINKLLSICDSHYETLLRTLSIIIIDIYQLPYLGRSFMKLQRI